MKIESTEAHNLALTEIGDLIHSDPAKGTPEGDRLEALAEAVEAYEKEHFPLVTEHPTLFKAPMVRRVIDGTKLQTRRVCTARNSLFNGGPFSKGVWGRLDFATAWVDPGPSPAGNAGPYLKVPMDDGDSTQRIYPRVLRGDHLWVRETFQVVYDCPHDVCSGWDGENEGVCEHRRAVYRATDPDGLDDYVSIESGDEGAKWKPSIFMPRWACRLVCEVTEVRAQRVQEITAEDIMAEGAVDRPHHDAHLGKMPVSSFDGKAYTDLRSLWAAGWDSINAKRGFGWNTNPWVWAFTFRLMSGI